MQRPMKLFRAIRRPTCLRPLASSLSATAFLYKFFLPSVRSRRYNTAIRHAVPFGRQRTVSGLISIIPFVVPSLTDGEELSHRMKCSAQCFAAILLALFFLLAVPCSLAQSSATPALSPDSLDVLYSRYQQPILLSTPNSLFPTVPQTLTLELPDAPLGSKLFANDPLNDSSSAPSIHPDLQPPTETKFRWKPAFKEALLYTGIMQAWRFPTEAGTRDALDGPFLKDYFNSVLATRGWDDGDTFITSYIAHPMEGGIFGYIQRQNDPLYRNVEIGDGRRYWISLLRSYAFAAVWSTQWTLGPVSEASLGNVQLHDSPGFVDVVGSETFGVFWMMGEDTLDKFGLAALENHTANRAVLVLARSFGNPCRTFANLMAFKKPWERPNRPGIFRDSFDLRSEYIRARRDGTWEGPSYVQQWRDFNHIGTGIDWRPRTGPLPQVPDFEVIANLPMYETFLGGGSCIGGGGSGTISMGKHWALVSDMAGCLIINMPHHQSGDSFSYLVGPRWNPRASHRGSPYAQVLVGGRRVSHEIDYPDIQKQLMKEWDDGDGTLPHFPKRSDYTTLNQVNAFALAAGGGYDFRVTRGLAWRVADVEYTHTFMPDVDMIHPQAGIRFYSGLIVRVGTW